MSDLFVLFEEARPAWQKDALCREYPAALFFSDQPGRSIAEAKQVCDRCAVQHECLEYALDTKQDFGVWGGTSEKTRRKIRRLRPKAEPQQPRDGNGKWVGGLRGHGTDACYKRGCRCQPCTQEHVDKNREYRQHKEKVAI